MRLYGEMYAAFEDLWSAIYDVRANCTRNQMRRLEEAVDALKELVGALPPERPLAIPEAVDPASDPPAG